MIRKFKIPLHPTRINLCVYIHEGLEDMKSGINEDLKENDIIDSITVENFVVYHEDLDIGDDYNPVIMAINKNDLTLGVIVHESYHVVSELFNSIGFRETFDNDEFGAYMIEYIVEEIIKQVEDILIKESYATEKENL